MSRKRQLKKERSRLAELDHRLEDLAERRADREILELVQAQARVPLSASAADLYGEALDRTVRRVLAGGDLPQLGRLLSGIRREAAARPWVRLAETVEHLAEGRLAEARAVLASLASAGEPGGAPPIPPQLLSALSDLAAPGAPQVPEVLGRFQRALDTLVEQGCSPDAVDRGRFEEVLATLRAALSSDPEAKRLLDAAQEFLRLLADLADLEQGLRREDFLDRVKRLSGPLLEAFRGGPPYLLHPLRHALRLRWRAILVDVQEQQGDGEVWTSAFALSPALFLLDLDVGAGPQGGVTRLANGQALRKLLAAEEHRELARRLASCGRGEPVPERLARLWSLELCMLDRAAAAAGDGEEGPGLEEVRGAEHATLVRISQMASDIAQRFPAEQRPEVARFLRARLFELLERLFFCSHFLAAAGALLAHLPDDPGLLALAVTAAVCAKDARALPLFASRIQARGEASPADRELLMRLVAQIALEPPRETVRILPFLLPLFGARAWPDVLAVLVQEVGEGVCSRLRWDWNEATVRDTLRDLEVYETALPGYPGIAALKAAVGCLGRTGRPEELRSFLERSPGLEPALAAFRVLAVAAGPWAPREVRKTLEETRDTVIARLDSRWRLWRPVLPSLVLDAGKGQVRRLRDRLRRILTRQELGQEDQRAVRQVLEEIEEMKRFERKARRALEWGPRIRTAPPKPEPGEAGGEPRRRKPRRRRADDEAQPALF